MKLTTIRHKVAPIFEKYGVKQAAVFGSVATRKDTEKSDIDLLISYMPSAKKSFFVHLQLEDELSKTLGRKVDLVTENGLSPFIRNRVLKEKRDIYVRKG